MHTPSSFPDHQHGNETTTLVVLHYLVTIPYSSVNLAFTCLLYRFFKPPHLQSFNSSHYSHCGRNHTRGRSATTHTALHVPEMVTFTRGEQWLNHPNTADMWLPRFLPLHLATSWLQLGLQSWTIHKQQLHQWRTVETRMAPTQM